MRRIALRAKITATSNGNRRETSAKCEKAMCRRAQATGSRAHASGCTADTHPDALDNPSTTSGRFCRRIRPERLRSASVSPGHRSRHCTAPAENRPEAQTHGEIRAHFLQNRSEVAGCERGQSRGGHQRASASATRSPMSKEAGRTRTPPPSPAHLRRHHRKLTPPPPPVRFRGGAGPRPAPPSLQARPTQPLSLHRYALHPFAEVLEGQRQHRGVAETRDGYDERFEQIGEERVLAVDAANAPDDATVFPTCPA